VPFSFLKFLPLKEKVAIRPIIGVTGADPDPDSALN
jgi:hypothetical protein